jgi:hypothetical protein
MESEVKREREGEKEERERGERQRERESWRMHWTNENQPCLASF